MSNAHDRQILNSVVNPLVPLGEGVYDDENVLDAGLRDREEDTEQVRYNTRKLIYLAGVGAIATVPMYNQSSRRLQRLSFLLLEDNCAFVVPAYANENS